MRKTNYKDYTYQEKVLFVLNATGNALGIIGIIGILSIIPSIIEKMNAGFFELLGTAILLFVAFSVVSVIGYLLVKYVKITRHDLERAKQILLMTYDNEYIHVNRKHNFEMIIKNINN